VKVHERFGTATVELDGASVDLAATRAEAYPYPGSLPVVRPAALADDLGRRDFTINAMAVPLAGDPELIDPHGGVGDLRSARIRVLHPGSFVDDPTRALRAARYAARLGFSLDDETDRLVRAADLESVSAERVEAEFGKLAAEPDPIAVLRMLVGWGLVEADVDLAAVALEILERGEWRELSDRGAALIESAGIRAGRFAAGSASAAARSLAAVADGRASGLASLARGRSGLELVVARALGAEWLDRYVAEWRHVRLEIAGDDLLAAGVPEGPAVGRGLAAALEKKLDGAIAGREAELSTALEAART
jgi:tRNA nucleotidyltransferase (CCA-adding enzyme)